MKKILIAILMVLVIIGAFVYSNKPKDQAPNKIVKIGYAPNVGFLPAHIAAEQDLFEKNNLKVELVQMQSAQQLYEALVRGDLDYVPFLSSIVVINGEQASGGNNVKLVTVSDISTENQFDDLLVKKDSPIKTVIDLAGKKIGVFPGTTGMNFTKKYLADKGVDISKIEFIQLPPPNQLTALEAGSVDVLHAYEPNLTLAIEKMSAVKLANESIFASQINHAAFGGYWFNAKFAAENPNLAAKLVTAMDEANAVISTDEATARAIAQKVYNLDEAVAQKVTLVKMVPATEFKPVLFTSFVDFLVSIGELKTKPDTTDIFY